MVKSDDHFESFESHTRLKHRILDAYLKAWSFKLLGGSGSSSRVFYVDCFAGEGHDRHNNPGSPTIACKVAIQVRAALESRGKKGREMAVVAIEEKKSRFRRLEQYLTPFSVASGVDLKILHGEAGDHMDAVTTEIGSRPALYFLDPFGVGGLDAGCYPSMLAGPQNEIFALFHDIGALRLRGILHSSTDFWEQIEKIRNQPSLFADEQDRIEAVLAEEARRQAHIDRIEPAARRNISRALGNDEWISDLAHLDNDAAREELILRFVKALLDAGGRNAVVLPMRDADGNHKYCLVHVSKSPAGYVTMKEAISEGLNDRSLAEEMRTAMKADLQVPVQEVLARLKGKFGGRTVRWPRDRSGDSVQWWLLTSTDVFSFQLNEIKQALHEQGWIKRIERREYCVIPER